MRFNYSQVEWILRGLAELNQGRWPDPDWSGDIKSATKKLNLWTTYFATPCELAGTVEMRLEQTGWDGVMAILYYSLSQTPEWIGRKYNLDSKTVIRHINSAISYISGKYPKDRSYKEFRWHMKGGTE